MIFIALKIFASFVGTGLALGGTGLGMMWLSDRVLHNPLVGFVAWALLWLAACSVAMAMHLA